MMLTNKWRMVSRDSLLGNWFSSASCSMCYPATFSNSLILVSLQKAIDKPKSLDNKDSAIAELGLLTDVVAADVAMLQNFFSARETQMAALFGRKLRRNPVRDELIRLVVLEYAAGRRRRPAYYIKKCASLATAPSIRSELYLLQHVGLIVMVDDVTHAKASLAAPTRKLIDFYNFQMPGLRQTIIELLKI